MEATSPVPSFGSKASGGSSGGSSGRVATYGFDLQKKLSFHALLIFNYRGETIPDALSVEEYGRLYNAYREGSEYSQHGGLYTILRGAQVG